MNDPSLLVILFLDRLVLAGQYDFRLNIDKLCVHVMSIFVNLDQFSLMKSRL